MAYTTRNFQTKKEIREAIASGAKLTCEQPGPYGPDVPMNGTIYLEGPHFPKPHKWYAVGTMKDGYLVSIK